MAEKEFGRAKRIWSKYPLLASFFVFLFFFLFFAFFYFSTPEPMKVGDFDRFFHFRLASLIREKGLSAVKEFDWIKLADFKQQGGFQLTSYHIALIPFTLFKNPILGSKLSDILWASLTLGLIYYVFRRAKVPAPLVFTLVIATCPALSMRLFLGRNLVLVMGMILLEIYLGSKKNYTLLFWVFLFHVLWHPSTFFLPVMIPIMVEAVRYVLEKEIVKKGIVVGILAPLLALALTPNFPGNVRMLPGIIFKIQGELVDENTFILTEGNELVTKVFGEISRSASLVLLIFIVGTGIVVQYYLESLKMRKNPESAKKNNDSETDLLMYANFVAAVFFLFGSFFASGRFLDFFLVSSVFLGALILKKTIEERRLVILKKLGRYATVSALVFFFLLIFSQLKAMALEPLDTSSYREAGEWLKENSKEGDLVFLDNWGQFPMIFFFDDKNTYSMGMEPMYLMKYSPELYWKWHNIYLNAYYCDQARDCAQNRKRIENSLADDPEKKEIFMKENSKKIIESIRNDFGAKFIVSGNYYLNQNLFLNKDLIENHKDIQMPGGGMLRVMRIKD